MNQETKKPLSAKLPWHYHRIPECLRMTLAKIIYSRAKIPPLSYPCEKNTELGRTILTHDIDTKGGFKRVKEIATVEMNYGFKSLWNVVGHGYRIDYGILDWLAFKGFEIGLHGYNHDNKLAFLPEAEIRRRLDKCRYLIDRYHITSFRSPSWCRSERLFNVLKDYLQYDYSYLDVDMFNGGGCLSNKPFRENGLTHIPTTVPYEAPLLFGYAPEQLLRFWQHKIKWLNDCNGDIVVNTHPDRYYSGNDVMIKSYEKLLLSIRKNGGY